MPRPPVFPRKFLLSLTEELHDGAKEIAADLGLTVAEVVRRSLRAVVQGHAVIPSAETEPARFSRRSVGVAPIEEVVNDEGDGEDDGSEDDSADSDVVEHDNGW